MDRKLIQFDWQNKHIKMELRQYEFGFICSTLDDLDSIGEFVIRGTIEDVYRKLACIGAANIMDYTPEPKQTLDIAGLLGMDDDCKFKVICEVYRVKFVHQRKLVQLVSENRIPKGHYMQQSCKHQQVKSTYQGYSQVAWSSIANNV